MIGSFGGIGLLLLALLGWCCYPASRVARAAAAAVAAGLVFLLAAPEDWMTGHRFGLPVLAPLLLLAGLGVAALLSPRRWRHPGAVAAAVAIAMCAGSALNLEASLRELHRYRLNQVNPAMSAGAYLEIGRFLARHADPSDRVLAYEIGAVGFASGLPIVDHQGLIDPAVAGHVAAAGGYTRVRLGEDVEAMAAIVKHCARQEPRWFLLRSRSPVPLTVGGPVPDGVAAEPIQNALLARLGPRMRLERVFALNGTGTDRYLVLHRAGAEAGPPESGRGAAMRR